MLQFGLEALLLYGLAAGQQPVDGLPAVAKILRTIKRMQDASNMPQTLNMCAPAVINRLHTSPITMPTAEAHDRFNFCSNCAGDPARDLNFEAPI